MPNHVTHRLNIKAKSKEAMDSFLAGISGIQTSDDAASPLDFNRLIPMPASVRNTESSGSTNVGLMLLGREDLLRDSILTGTSQSDAYLTYPWVIEAGVTTKEELFEFLKKRTPDAIEKGQQAIAAYEETGFISWYEWCCANWGTKWNAYSQNLTRIDDTHAELVFNTAWSTPDPVFNKMAEMFPEIHVRGYAFDEGWGFACEINLDNDFAQISEVNQAGMNAVYEKVYGEAPTVYDDEEEDA